MAEANRIYVAPTELPLYLNADSYRDFAPTELFPAERQTLNPER